MHCVVGQVQVVLRCASKWYSVYSLVHTWYNTKGDLGL